MYKIKCSHSDAVYIGETSRTIGSRIKEHIRMVKQTVCSHLINHNKPSMQDMDVTNTGNGEWGTGNGERGTGNGSLGTSVQRQPA